MVEEAVQPAAANIWKWLLPVLGVAAVLGLILWYAATHSTPTPPKVPDFTQVSTDLTGSFKSLTDSLTSIKDVASAEAALPKLKELDTKLDGMKALVDKLPDADKGKITDLIKASYGKLEDQFAKLLWIPGVSDKIKTVVDEVMGKMAALGGFTASKISTVSSELAGTFTSLTAALTGIKDSASAEAALPRLRDISDKLDGAKSALNGLSEAGRTTIITQMKAALTKFKEMADKVLAMSGVSDKIKPTLDAIMGKLNSLVA
jgi:hypothetical protein